MEELKSTACRAIDAASLDLKALSKEIYDNPELNFEEFHAHEVLTCLLEKYGFVVERSFKVATAFKATHGSNDNGGPNIAVLCEYDALPGLGHACGHNLIAEVGVATALGAKAAMEACGKPLGKLTVLGTPAEEGGGGKVDLIRAGAFSDVDVAMMAHPSQCNLPRPVMVAMNQATIRFRGRASHAASFPWNGVNALDAAVLCYQNISCLRQQIKPTWRIHGVISNGGAKPNIIPELTELQYMIRAPTDPELAILKTKFEACVHGAAQATGCTVECQFDEKPYSALMSNNILAALYETNGVQVGIQFEQDPAKIAKQGGSTDMGNVSHVVPSIHPKFHFGTTASGHSADFAKAAGKGEAQGYTLSVGKALAMTVIDLFLNPDLIPQIQGQFQLDLQKEEQLVV
ncbi:xaa-Arg dipeptidase-like [Haliotis asinina]|uniref:xaa-Arg dipeptidase-like n=1 Tax=Haliotis asinina TaxID=109174 RepID=UPI003531F2F8